MRVSSILDLEGSFIIGNEPCADSCKRFCLFLPSEGHRRQQHETHAGSRCVYGLDASSGNGVAFRSFLSASSTIQHLQFNGGMCLSCPLCLIICAVVRICFTIPTTAAPRTKIRTKGTRMRETRNKNFKYGRTFLKPQLNKIKTTV